MKRHLLLLMVVLLFPAPAPAGESTDPEGKGGEADPAALLTRADDLLAMMEVYADAGRWPSAIAKGRDAVNLYLGLGMKRTSGRALTRIGALCLKAGLINEARRELEGALVLEREIGDRIGACLSLSLLALVGLEGPVPAESIPHLLEAFDIVRKHDLRGPFLLLTATAKKVRKRLSAGKPAPADYFDLLTREIDFQGKMGWLNHAEALYFEKIEFLRRDERFSEAAAACRELAAFNELRGYRYGMASAAHNLGLVLASDRSLGSVRYEKAEEAYRTSERIRREIGDFANLAWTLNNRGHLFLERKKYGEAEPLLGEARRLFARYHIRSGEKTVLRNLLRLGRETGREPVQKGAESALLALEKMRVPESREFKFTPKKTHLAYYLFLRDQDLAPVVEIRGEESRLVFTVLSTGEAFDVPVSPRPKKVRISFEAPQNLLASLDKEKPAVAICSFGITGGRAVRYGRRFLFLAPGLKAWADREGNLRLEHWEGGAEGEWRFDSEAEAYPETSTPALALRTFVESINRGDWEVFSSAVSRFALTYICRESFEATAEKHRALPLGISIREGKMRNSLWVEIRYSYRPLVDRGLRDAGEGEEREKKRRELEERFRKTYGENRYKAFLVREGGTWRLDFHDRES